MTTTRGDDDHPMFQTRSRKGGGYVCVPPSHEKLLQYELYRDFVHVDRGHVAVTNMPFACRSPAFAGSPIIWCSWTEVTTTEVSITRKGGTYVYPSRTKNYFNMNCIVTSVTSTEVTPRSHKT